MCATSCPVQIDTGQLVKLLRKQAHSKLVDWVALLIAEHFRSAEAMVRQMLALAHFGESVVGCSMVAKLSECLRLLLSRSLPAWQRDMPYPALRAIQHGTRSRAEAVYLPSCISRVMGEADVEPHLPTTQDVFLELADRAGISMFVPEDAAGTCCGTPFGSKGFERAQERALNLAIERLWVWSDSGRLPIVMDTTPCSYAFRTCRPYLSLANRPKLDRMQIFDAVEYVHDTLLKRLKITNRLRTVALHPVCSLVKLGLQPKFEHIARACSENVLLPQSSECCGFAGDRGFLFPELTASATRAEAAELKGVACEGFYSSSRTCEIAMTRATGEVYRSYLHLVHRATDPELVTDDVRHFPGDAKNADTGSKSGFEMDVQRQKT